MVLIVELLPPKGTTTEWMEWYVLGVVRYVNRQVICFCYVD